MSKLEQTLAGDLAEWGPRAHPKRSPMAALWLALVLGVPVLLVALLLGLFLSWIVGAAVALLLGIAIGLWLRAQVGSGLQRAGAKPLDSADAPRLFNVARGLATDLGTKAPALWVVEDGGPNALIGRSGSQPVIAVSRALLDTYTRTELEGVVAHCLLRLDPSLLRRATLAAALGEGAGPAGALDLVDVDARAAALTRYPIGLADAVEKASPHEGRGDSFWFVPASGRYGSRESRAALLRDL